LISREINTKGTHRLRFHQVSVPIHMNPYINGKIYQLTAPDGQCYVGSTIQPLKIRLRHHLFFSKQCHHRHTSSVQLFQQGDVNISLIEEFPCEKREDLLWRERYWIENLDCVNIQSPIVTETEKKETQARCNARLYVKKREKIRQYQLEKIPCPSCGILIGRTSLPRHKRRMHSVEPPSPPVA